MNECAHGLPDHLYCEDCWFEAMTQREADRLCEEQTTPRKSVSRETGQGTPPIQKTA